MKVLNLKLNFCKQKTENHTTSTALNYQHQLIVHNGVLELTSDIEIRKFIGKLKTDLLFFIRMLQFRFRQ